MKDIDSAALAGTVYVSAVRAMRGSSPPGQGLEGQYPATLATSATSLAAVGRVAGLPADPC